MRNLHSVFIVTKYNNMKKLILALVLLSSTLSMKSEGEIDLINKYQLCKSEINQRSSNRIDKRNIKQLLLQKQQKRNNYPITDNFHTNIELIKKLCAENNIPYKAIIWLWWRESNWGNSKGAKVDNIHFGVKCHGKKGAMYFDDCKGKCCFISYRTFEDSVKDLMSFFKRNKRYADSGLFAAKTAEDAVKALKRANYATDPNFLKSFYNEYKTLNIDEL